MNSREIINLMLNENITQQELGDYLELTRQTVSKISNGDYVKLPKKSKYKLKRLENRSIEGMKKLIELDKYINDIRDRVLEGNEEYVGFAYEGFKYMHYWLNDEKFKNQVKYHEYLFGHMNNFYPRFNQAALFMRDTLDRQRYPLITFQINYEKKLIEDMCIKAFTDDNDKEIYQTNDISFPITMQKFIDIIIERIKPSPRFLVYRDYLDDDWDFILSNIKKQLIHYKEIYDLSRLFNFFENQQPYFGPLIEHVLDQFRIAYDLKKLLTNCHYRADKIVELVNMVSLEDLHNQKHDKSRMMFDSHGFIRDNKYIQNERRKLKRVRNGSK